MTPDQQALHDRLDKLSAEISKQITLNPVKAQGLIRHFTDLVAINFKQTIRQLK